MEMARLDSRSYGMQDAMQSSRPSLILLLYYVLRAQSSSPSPLSFLSSCRSLFRSCTSVSHFCLYQAYISCSCLSLPGWVLQPQSRRFEEDFRYFPLELRGS